MHRLHGVVRPDGEPDVATVVLDMISLNYSETLSAAAGHSMEEAKAQTIAAGNYLFIYEGAVLEAFDGQASARRRHARHHYGTWSRPPRTPTPSWRLAPAR